MQTGQRFSAEACGLCDSMDREVLATRGRGHQPLTTAVCRGCGLVSHHPLPSAAEMAAFYAKEYRVAYKGGFEPKRKHSLRALRGAMSRARRLMPFLHRGGHILDIGASSGEFVYVMTRSGLDARGIEPNEAYADFARQSYGVAMQTGGFEQAAPEQASLDLVTMNHVLEHVADPWQALRRIHAWLAEDGVLFLEVPNLSATHKQVSNIFHRAHIWNFTPETLLLLAWQCGFVPMEGEDTRRTSVIFRKCRDGDAAPIGAGPALAESLVRQMETEAQPIAYLVSGKPFTRRWARLRRNIGEWLICRRHASVRDMADALVHSSPAPRPRLVDQDRPTAIASLTV
ncbi:MAG: class I SAM-dependent methyltransferase [Roseomonas sp.]|nr:class I SAM-dependent methyltransferase [Roseomonas sp.]